MLCSHKKQAYYNMRTTQARPASILRLANCLRFRLLRGDTALSVAFSTSVSAAARMTSTWQGWPWYGLIRPCARYVRRRVFCKHKNQYPIVGSTSPYSQVPAGQQCFLSRDLQHQYSWHRHWIQHSSTDE